MGIAVLNSKAFVVPHGSQTGAASAMVYGTNPMAFAMPRPQGLPPLVWDQASSAMARGEISMYQQAGLTLPPGCAVDLHGKPTTDPSAALDGAQLTFAQHKGSAIAMMVELLSGGLTGGDFSFDARDRCPDEWSATPTRNSELLIALDPATVGGLGEAAVLAHCERLYERVLSTEGTQLPSTGRHCGQDRLVVRAQSEADGVTIPTALVEECEQLCEDAGLITNPFFPGGVDPADMLRTT